jgi:hypothetical protein
VFIDFTKAFDHVDHNILVAKLLAFGLPDTVIRWMCVLDVNTRYSVAKFLRLFWSLLRKITSL